MNEKFITAGIGITAGIIIACGIFFWFSRPKAPPPSPTPLTTLTTPTPAPQPLSITIDSPSDGDVVSESPVSIAGKTAPNVTVILTTPADEKTVIADANGQFMAKLKIEDGENTVTASIVDERGTLQIAKKQIILEIQNQ